MPGLHQNNGLRIIICHLFGFTSNIKLTTVSKNTYVTGVIWGLFRPQILRKTFTPSKTIIYSDIPLGVQKYLKVLNRVKGDRR